MDIEIDRLESFDGGIFRWNLSFFWFLVVPDGTSSETFTQFTASKIKKMT